MSALCVEKQTSPYKRLEIACYQTLSKNLISRVQQGLDSQHSAGVFVFNVFLHYFYHRFGIRFPIISAYPCMRMTFDSCATESWVDLKLTSNYRVACISKAVFRLQAWPLPDKVKCAVHVYNGVYQVNIACALTIPSIRFQLVIVFSLDTY